MYVPVCSGKNTKNKIYQILGRKLLISILCKKLKINRLFVIVKSDFLNKNELFKIEIKKILAKKFLSQDFLQKYIKIKIYFKILGFIPILEKPPSWNKFCMVT